MLRFAFTVFIFVMLKINYLRRGRQPGDLLRSDGTLPPLSSFSIASLCPHEVGMVRRGGQSEKAT